MEQRLSLATIKGGAAIEMVDDAIQELLENIVDPNTDATTKRKVTLTLTLAPDQERESMHVKIDVRSSFAPHEAVGTIAFIAHTRDGVVAVENDPKQRQLFEEEPKGEGAAVVDITEGGKK